MTFFQWPDIASFGPFVLVQLAAIWVVVRLRHYCNQLMLATQALARHVQEIDEINTQLEQAHHCRDTFVCQASHELKTPLTTLQGHVQLASRRLVREPPLPINYAFLPKGLTKIETQTSRLRTLVDDLLNLSYLSSGEIPLRLGPCDLASLCRNITEDLSLLNDRQIELNCPSDQLVIQADEDRLTQVILNLLGNALKYSPASTIVRVDLSNQPGEVLLAVHNEGSFISPEQQEHLFEPFYRGPGVWCSAISGWGIGLTLSKHLVEQQGGGSGCNPRNNRAPRFLFGCPLPLRFDEVIRWLLPEGARLQIDHVVCEAKVLTIEAVSTQQRGNCPECGHITMRIHRRYRRTLQDLPWTTMQVRLHIQVHRFFCENPDTMPKIV